MRVTKNNSHLFTYLSKRTKDLIGIKTDSSDIQPKDMDLSPYFTFSHCITINKVSSLLKTSIKDFDIVFELLNMSLINFPVDTKEMMSFVKQIFALLKKIVKEVKFEIDIVKKRQG